MPQADVVVVGGGVVGLATAYKLTEMHPGKRVVVLEKEAHLAHHQTGHNSGVLHSGIYYKPGSLKAINCREGKKELERFCAEHGIPYDICGKVIVAIDEEEVPRLEGIYQRGQDNGIRCEMISKERLHELEPYCAGIKAIHVHETGIVNYTQVCEKLGEIIQERGGEFFTRARVTDVDVRADGLTVESEAGDFECQFLVNCAGLHCDRVARLTGQIPDAKIVPFRGEYFALKDEVKHLCRNLIYPTPDPQFPFLGVHFTRMIDGSVECGPNAVLAFAREGYTMADVNVYDLFESLTYPGFVKMAAKYWKMGAGEMWRSFSKAAFVKALQRLMPSIRAEHLNAAPAGIRAQAVTSKGELADDFIIAEAARVVNVLNAPSPAATSCLNIGREVVTRLEKHFG